MRILGHIHTLNDADVIERSLAALKAQTRPLDGIVIIDNASTDDTLERIPSEIPVVRHERNTGTSGAVVSGLEYGLEHGYDCVWVFDADTAPHPDALEKLLRLREDLPPDIRGRTRVVASLPRNVHDDRAFHGVVFDERGVANIEPSDDTEWYECDGTMWTGSLFDLAAVREIGLPRADWVLDWGEYEYGYVGKRAGWHTFMHTGSLADHNIGGETSMAFGEWRLGPLRMPTFDLPPIRCYYVVRNTLVFWLHEYRPRSAKIIAMRMLNVCRILVNFGVRPIARRAQLTACLRGLVDGLLGRLAARY